MRTGRRALQQIEHTSVVCRRDLLKVGPLAVSASLWPSLLAPGIAHGSESPLAKAKSVIFLWMGGGVTQLETFDPKPEAPVEVRGKLGTAATSLPGVYFSEACPQLAQIAHELSVVRTFAHDSNDHLLSQVYTLSGRKVTPAQLFSEPNIGAIVQYLLGSRNGLPGYIAVPGITRPGPPPHNLFVGGWLGAQYAPFCLGGQPAQPDFTAGLSAKPANPSPLAEESLAPPELQFPQDVTIGRLERRSQLRTVLEQSAQAGEASLVQAGLEGQFDGALRLLTSTKVRNAFDIAQEPAALREDYGRTKLGGRCLVARKLVEAGARFVMVDYGYDPDYGNLWDIHNVPEQRFPHTSDMALRGYNVAGMDRAFAALIRDLKERGLLESTLVVYLTEFGRTPKINAGGGRDHWGMCGSMFFAGAGVKAGQVVGQSDAQAAFPVTRGYGPADIAATMYHLLGIDPETRVRDTQGRPAPALDHGNVIEEVLA
ncbi:MAG TPA: DUF1501 domain-containing protein [Planctomycetaceae bacterium]|nr:DUF1501 domain-containing protein [Planctomycetaceae bacterium]